MDGYIAKPVSLTVMQKEIRRLFGGKQPATAAPAATAPAAVAVIFDRKAAIAMMGDENLFAEVAGMFVADVPGYLDEIDAALAAGEADRLARAAHTVKGLFATFVAPAGQSVAQQLEQTARGGNLAACGELATVVRAKTEALSAALAHK